MCEQFVGCCISVHVGGGLGFYQGTVKSVNTSNQMITLIKVLHNGKPFKNPEVTINAADILDLKLLSSKDIKCQETSRENSASSQATSDSNTNAKERAKVVFPLQREDASSSKDSKENKSSNTETSLGVNKILPKLLPSQSNSEPKEKLNYPVGPTILKRKQRTSVGEILACGSQANEHVGSCDRNPGFGFTSFAANHEYGPQRRNVDEKQNKRQWNKSQWKTHRDETTFGTPIDQDVLSTEFDFEKNLALFDKRAVMEEIENSKPDVVRQADRKVDKKYRCDENILSTKSEPRRQIIVPASEAGEILYVTDNGLLVPSVSAELRLNLLSTANQVGLTKSRQLEMIGRGATDVILSVIGGSHRLEPGNSHQAPVVILLCGANAQGASGVNCGRQLESQGVQTVVVTPPLPSSPNLSLLLSHEMQLYEMTSGRIQTDVLSLPFTVDLIVDARFDLLGSIGTGNQCWHSDTNLWAARSRAPILALDPPSDAPIPFTPRILVCPSLPLAYAPDKGKVYLLNLNIPQQVFSSLNIQYTSPFGAKMAIPLHPCE